VLEDVLPPDAHEADLISVLRASCNIPFYFNGNSLAVGVWLSGHGSHREGDSCLSPELTRPRGSTLQYDVISPGQPISDSELEATYNTLFLAGREASNN
ncbi:hypothetical protein B484DRAFT_425378, partial [Ochromonadaceae sp. CCMP2298]